MVKARRYWWHNNNINVRLRKCLMYFTTWARKSFLYLVHKHWVQSRRHRLWFWTKTCSCYSTKTYVDSVILILKLKLTSLRNIYIKMYVVLNEDHFYCICFSTKSNSIWGWGSYCLHECSLSNNYTVFVENHNLWRFDCTQW